MGKLIPLEVKVNWLISLWVVLEIVSAGWMTRDRDGEVHPPTPPSGLERGVYLYLSETLVCTRGP